VELWTPEAHEPLVDDPWNPARIRAAIGDIARDVEAAFDDGWPPHPRDVEPDDPGPYACLYCGAAGVIDGLRRLGERGFVELGRDYIPFLERLEPDAVDAGVWVGETGIQLVVHRLAPSAANRERLQELVASNVDDERRELMWGSPGTMLVARELGFTELWEQSAERLRAARDLDTGLWTQHLYGAVEQYLGPAHGFAGCVLALGNEPGVAETARRFAIVADGLANWPPTATSNSLAGGDGRIRVQWCHGAPGIVASLAHLLDEDLALAGAELTWRAGPIGKGANLCHGTAGNGYAFLALFERTGDERWLDRARRFAVHAAAQVERARFEHGMGRYSLWTGDLGTALYLADCLDGSGALPIP
jgi:hypothetical protein